MGGTINDVIFFKINQIVRQKEIFQSLENLDVFLLRQKDLCHTLL